MTVPAIVPISNDHPAGAYRPDRRILSRREFEALSVIVDIMTADRPADAIREMECTENPLFGGFSIDVPLRRIGGDPAGSQR